MEIKVFVTHNYKLEIHFKLFLFFLLNRHLILNLVNNIFCSKSISINENKIEPKKLAGTPGNRTQLCSFATDNGFEGRGEHQLLNHSQA